MFKCFSLLACLGLLGCNQSNNPPAKSALPTSTPVTNSTDRAPVNVGADNTAKNVRDRQDSAKTPIDQNENQTDISMTANIRSRVMDAKLSVNAQNVKIITQDGRVTLRGPVNSAAEKNRIEEIAKSVAGDKVDSQLELNANP